MSKNIPISDIKYPLQEAARHLLDNDDLASYTADASFVKITKKPTRYLSVNFRGAKILGNKKKLVIVDKKYEFPEELESAVCWDILNTWYKIVSENPETIKAWNSLYIAKYFPPLVPPSEEAA